MIGRYVEDSAVRQSLRFSRFQIDKAISVTVKDDRHRNAR